MCYLYFLQLFQAYFYGGKEENVITFFSKIFFWLFRKGSFLCCCKVFDLHFTQNCQWDKQYVCQDNTSCCGRRIIVIHSLIISKTIPDSTCIEFPATSCLDMFSCHLPITVNREFHNVWGICSIQLTCPCQIWVYVSVIGISLS